MRTSSICCSTAWRSQASVCSPPRTLVLYAKTDAADRCGCRSAAHDPVQEGRARARRGLGGIAEMALARPLRLRSVPHHQHAAAHTLTYPPSHNSRSLLRTGIPHRARTLAIPTAHRPSASCLRRAHDFHDCYQGHHDVCLRDCSRCNDQGSEGSKRGPLVSGLVRSDIRLLRADGSRVPRRGDHARRPAVVANKHPDWFLYPGRDRRPWGHPWVEVSTVFLFVCTVNGLGTVS